MVKLGCALVMCVLTVAAAPPAQSVAPLAHFQCLAGRSFDVRLLRHAAHVQFDGREYILDKRPESSLGLRFSGRGSELIIDGTYAALVTAHAINLERCRSTEPIAPQVVGDDRKKLARQ